jgi:DNA-binding CsgD family transcriptional regulator
MPDAFNLNRTPDEVRQILQSCYGPSGVVVDEEWQVAQFRGDSKSCLEHEPRHISYDLLNLVPRALRSELRDALEHAKRDGLPYRKTNVRNDKSRLTLDVIPIRLANAARSFFMVLLEELPGSSGHPSLTSPELDAAPVIPSESVQLTSTSGQLPISAKHPNAERNDNSYAMNLFSLSKRELDVFRHIGEGLTTLDIAKTLHLSPKTVETHRLNIKKKLNLANGAMLVREASRWVCLMSLNINDIAHG